MKVLAALNNGDLAADLAAEGSEVLCVDSMDDLQRGLESDPAFLVVDLELDFAADLVAHIKAKLDGPDRDRLPIIAMGSRSAEHPYCVPDAQFETGEAEQVLKAAKGIMFRRARQRRLFDQEMFLKVPTITGAIDKAGDLLEKFVEAAGFSEEEGIKLGHTLREAVGNAAEHGNRHDPERTIHINFYRTADRVTFVIQDEGPGFDTEAFLNRAEAVSALEHTRSRREVEARPGGLGVFIMKETCDDITFNTKGNAIYLTKFLPGMKP